MKKIIIACDGTAASASRGERSISSNVNRICNALRNNADVQQLVFYQSGVGTGTLGTAWQAIAGATGIGLDDNVVDAYNFLINNYLPGDKIYCFGWSRGAFTVRVLASFIARVGIFIKSYSWCLKVAYKAYQGGKKDFEKYLENLEKQCKGDIDHHNPARSQKVTVKVVGAWDTVASMGIPDFWYARTFNLNKATAYYDPTLIEGIENAFHALSLDEKRYVFAPTLFYLPAEEGIAATINLKQYWFPGGHKNVGGGLSDQKLADLTLAWMIDLCRPYLSFDERYIDMVIHIDHHPEAINSALRRAKGGYEETYPGWALGRLFDAWTWGWRLLGGKVRTPGEYQKLSTTPVGRSHEMMHASVRERWTKMPNWRPDALKHFEPKETRTGDWEWVKPIYRRQSIVLPEAPFTTNEASMEWKLRYADLHTDDEPARRKKTK